MGSSREKDLQMPNFAFLYAPFQVVQLKAGAQPQSGVLNFLSAEKTRFEVLRNTGTRLTPKHFLGHNNILVSL